MYTTGGRVISVPILTYHQVQPVLERQVRQPGLVVDVTSFRRQVILLRLLGYRSLTLDDLTGALMAGRPLPPRGVVITFDDGYAGVFDYAFPTLKRHGFTATCFLIAEDFEKDHPRTERSFPVVTPAQVSEMLKAGFQIGSHSVTHARLTELPGPEAQTEIIRSKQILEDAFGRRITAFSYPYGLYNREVQVHVAGAGYACATTTRFGHRHLANDPFALKSVAAETADNDDGVSTRSEKGIPMSSEERYALKRIPVGFAQRLPHFVYRLSFAREA